MYKRKSRLDEQRDVINEQAAEILSLQQKLFAAFDNYEALEKGMDELQDGFDQMSLDWRDELIKKDERIKYLEAELEVHHAGCLMALEIPDRIYTPQDEDVPTIERQSNVEPQ